MNAKERIKEIVESLIAEVKNMSGIIHFSKSSEGDYHDGMKLGSMLGRYETEVEFLLKELPEEIDTCGLLKTCEPEAEENPAVFGKWYRPEEKMPETNKSVLVEFVEGGMATAFYRSEGKTWYSNVIRVAMGTVARWCELPKGLPKKEDIEWEDG